MVKLTVNNYDVEPERRGSKSSNCMAFVIVRFLERYKLPDQFCGKCTLKEGTVVVILVLQSISALAAAFLFSTLFVYPDESDEWWFNRFREDYDPYIFNEYRTEIIDKYYPLWRPVSYVLLGVEGSYFVSGFGVMYGLWSKEANPKFYLPWLGLTGILVACNFLAVFCMFVMTCIISAYREITVTWDIVPMIVCSGYACGWGYGFLVVLAHYKRRMIVKYWRDLKKKEGQGHWGNNSRLN